MKKRLIALFSLSMFLLVLNPIRVMAHCELPCGIYNDKMRIDMIKEDISTIEKSMNQIVELSKATPLNYNQIVRWVNNKEEHANKIQEVATQYFMFQRVTLTDDPALQKKNAEMLRLLHQLCVYAMKAKQTTDLGFVEKMKAVTEDFAKLYLGENYDHDHK